MGKLVKYNDRALKPLSDADRKDKALALKQQEIDDNRTVGQVARDVHLTNIGAKKRPYEEQIADREYLYNCLACWDLMNIENGQRETVEHILMERYWLVE